MKLRPPRRLTLETLESRWTPASLHAALIDDFVPQPLMGETQEFSFYNALGGDRGEVRPDVGGDVAWNSGWVRAAVTQDFGYAGLFQSINGLIRDGNPLNLDAVFPPEILPQFQPRATGLTLDFRGGAGPVTVKIESPAKQTLWSHTEVLSGAQFWTLPLPAGIKNAQAIVITVDGAAGNFFELNEIRLQIESPEMGKLEPAVWSGAALLGNLDRDLWIVGDRMNFGAADMGNVPATGGAAMALAELSRLGVVAPATAEQAVERITETFHALPTHNGLHAHFVSHAGQFQILAGTEFSSVDSVVGLGSLLQARQSLGLPTEQVEQMVRDIQWEELIHDDGTISHGYSFDGQLLPTGWDVFGSEAFLVGWAYAAARPTAELASLTLPNPPSFDNAEFNDELAPLLFPMTGIDAMGNDWLEYRVDAAASHYAAYEDLGAPICCLSPAEVAAPWTVATADIYQAFGLGGWNHHLNDGVELTGNRHAAPHSLGLTAVHEPRLAMAGWEYLKQQGALTPLNTVESLQVVENGVGGFTIEVNPLKSSWNLWMQTMGWVRAAAPQHYGPHLASVENEFVSAGLARVMPTPAPHRWHNFEQPADVDGDGTLQPFDLTIALGHLLLYGSTPLAPGGPGVAGQMVDVIRDNLVLTEDILEIVTLLILQARGEAEHGGVERGGVERSGAERGGAEHTGADYADVEHDMVWAPLEEEEWWDWGGEVRGLM